MNEAFALPQSYAETRVSCGVSHTKWLIVLAQKVTDSVRYYTGTPPTGERWLGGLTTQPKNAESYSRAEAAQATIDKLPKHPWGQWEARSFSNQLQVFS